MDVVEAVAGACGYEAQVLLTFRLSMLNGLGALQYKQQFVRIQLDLVVCALRWLKLRQSLSLANAANRLFKMVTLVWSAQKSTLHSQSLDRSADSKRSVIHIT